MYTEISCLLYPSGFQTYLDRCMGSYFVNSDYSFALKIHPQYYLENIVLSSREDITYNTLPRVSKLTVFKIMAPFAHFM